MRWMFSAAISRDVYTKVCKIKNVYINFKTCPPVFLMLPAAVYLACHRCFSNIHAANGSKYVELWGLFWVVAVAREFMAIQSISSVV